MDFLAENTNLGNLEVLEIYVQYNGPRLLSCKNQADKIFLAVWVDEEEDEDFWLYMLVSLDKLKSIRVGQISLYQAFSDPESGSLYEVKYIYSRSEWYIKQTTVEELDDDCLPLEDTFINCDPKTLPKLRSQKAIQNAILKSREIVNLVLAPPETDHPNEFPAFELGKILSAFQPLVNQLGVLVNTDSELRPKDISQKAAFNIFATSPGSFQIEMASSIFEVNIFGNSLAGDAIEKLFYLISNSSNLSALQRLALNKRTVAKYQLFLESLVRSGADVRFEWGSPSLTRGGCVEASIASLSDALEAIKKIDLLETKEYEIVGELFKVDKNSWKFGIKEIKTGFLYKGDILDQAKSDAATATISRLYIAMVLEVPELLPTTNDIKSYYRLLALRPYESPSEQLELVKSN